MGVCIIADSASDIPQKTAKEWNITVLPMNVRFGEEEFLDGVTLAPDEFFNRLKQEKEPPKTSQITPLIYEETFGKAIKNGDDVLCFCLSSGVSGSYQSALIAADEVDGYVSVIDTQQFCISEYVIVKRAVHLRDEGKSAKEIDAIIRKELPNAHVLAAFDTLEYLKKGGRLSSAKAIVGKILSVKPLLTIEDGVVNVWGKARGTKNIVGGLMDKAASYEIDFDKPIMFGFTGAYNDSINLLMDRFRKTYKITTPVTAVPVGATIGTYAGPGAVAVAFFSKEKE